MSAYSTRHNRVIRKRGKAATYQCVVCTAQAQEWAQLKGTDGEDPEDYQPMCCSCHQKYDDHWNKATRAKVAATSAERWTDPEYKARVGRAISEAKMGHEVSEETRRKSAEFMKGNSYAAGKRTPEQCERIRIARWGR